jgi:putative SOS response-associated peptidase YedK
MCGRYTLKTDRSKIEQLFDVDDLPDFQPRYNIAPTQDCLIVRSGSSSGNRSAAWLHWGLIPSWTKDSSESHGWINARSETAASKPSFRNAFKSRRCLVLADGFYEWNRMGSAKMPYHFTVNHGAPFAMAGLWERWQPPGAGEDGIMETFTILTTTANEILAQHHDRMPVIIDPEFYEDWLNPLLVDADSVQRMVHPYPSRHMLARAVNPRVNNIHFDDPQCLEPPPDTIGQQSSPKYPASNAGQEQLDFGLGD